MDVSSAAHPEQLGVQGSGLFFRVLGPLEVHAGDRVHTMTGSLQRTLLTSLLISPGQPLAAEQLYGELWGENPPPTFENSLQAHVYRLRRTLQKLAGPNRTAPELLTRSSGYALDLRAGAIDAETFRGLSSRARECMRREPERAYRLFGEALSLWRGEPLQGVAQGPMCQSMALALEEEHLAVVEDTLWLGMQLADPVHTISELKRMSSIHPWRERLTEMLMLALYRAGRQAEAVEAYNSARLRLVNELGLEPSAKLRRLLQDILNQDPALDFAGLVPGAAL
ncbi:AfsR/SARP family transcriptional regulator [Streptomyces sp. NBC_01429]|uniref:AfsR/SARP family transcriptional regulator n=1 Tax=Streptomyces sp. NBC_01429 TaxID=2903862 RepID=UPI002E2E59E3|nr:AfsR/SARP family transcriptional regulator [Streptomyces sp. NBC_01429]